MKNKQKREDSSFIRRALRPGYPFFQKYLNEMLEALEEDGWRFSNFNMGFGLTGKITVAHGLTAIYSDFRLDAEGNFVADLDLNLHNNEFEEGDEGWIPLIEVRVWVETNMAAIWMPCEQPHRIGWEIAPGDLTLFKRTKGYLPKTPRLTRRPV